MEKINKPSNLGELLMANLVKKKANEKRITPTTSESFDKQQSERFSSSAKNFSEWHMEVRKELYDLEKSIFDRWKESYSEQLLIDWKKGLLPKETALNIVNLFLSVEQSGIKKKR